MSRIDASIESDRSRNRIAVIASGTLLTVALGSYLIWLFLVEGFTFSVTPDQAADAPSFTVESGTGLFIKNKLYVLGLPVSVRVEAPKFKAGKVTVDNSSPSNIEVALTPLPATVNVSTSTTETDIQWLVNGKPYATAASVTLSLPQGSHSVTAEHPGYESASINIQTEIAQTLSKTITLDPVEGKMVLRSRPAGAAVTVNGELKGSTPLTISHSGGTHSLVIESEGYEPVKDSISITASTPVAERHYQLIPVQATLDIKMTPAKGLLTVDGKTVDGPVVSVDANVEHIVSYSAPGYEAQRQTVTPKAATTTSLEFNLAPQMGELSITSNLPAQVYIDGNNAGTTPLTTQLQTLAHSIEISKPGYRTISKNVTPSAQQVTSVNAELLTEFDARRKEGKPLFAETIGIQLIILKPDTIMMGSPPNEAGRQRNEHQYSVDFTRQFWLSRHEITEAQFAKFKGGTTSSDKPVTNISWLDAAAFTNWLSKQEGLPPFYIIGNGQLRGIDPASKGYRLPTEAEWEFAAKQNQRAALTQYVWGNQDRIRDKQGNFADSSLKGKQTFILPNYSDGFAGKAPVGSFKADRGGFFDLDGNVREWVHDFYTVTPPQTSATKTDYLGSSPSSSHVVKGASFKTGRLKRLRASMRTGESGPQDDIGFRVARYHD